MLKLNFFLFLYVVVIWVHFVQSIPGEITLDRTEPYNYDTSYLTFHELRTTKFNRTTYIVNGRLTFKKPVEGTWNAYYQLDTKQGNEYRTLVSGKANYDDLIKKFRPLYNQLVGASNFPGDPPLPIPPNEYYIKHLGIQIDYALLKTNKSWKFLCKMLDGDHEVYGYAIYFEVSMF